MQLVLYFAIGKYLSQHTRNGVWGEGVLATDNEIDIFHTMQVANVAEFPIADFFKVPFTHHSIIIGGTKDIQERYYYIHRTAEEHIGIRKLRQLIKEEAHKSQGNMPNNFTRTINAPIEARRAVEMFKDEYLLDFINNDRNFKKERIIVLC